jgi:hypothetical protein
MDSIDDDRAVEAACPQHSGSNNGRINGSPHHSFSNDAPSYVSRRISSKRKLGRSTQLALLEQQVLSQSEQNQNRANINEQQPTNVDIAVIPLRDDTSMVASNDVESSEKIEDITVKRKTCETMMIPAALYDCKLTIDMKIQKHIDLNLIPMNRPKYRMNAQNSDSFILTKLKEQFHTTTDCSINRDASEYTDNMENTQLHTSGLRHSARHDDLECGQVDDDKVNDEIEKPHSLLESHRSREFLEYDVMDESTRDLAVAVHVDDDSHLDIPAAIQYDPNTKPFLYMSRRFFLLVYLIIIAVLSGVVGGCIGMVSRNKNKHIAPIVKQQYSRSVHIRETIERFIVNEQLDDTTSPYHNALNWLTLVDLSALTLDSAKFAQRYLVAYLYFATSTKQPWETGCAPANYTTEITTQDNHCIYTLPANTIDADDKYEEPRQISALRWLSEQDVCEWAGVHCDDVGQVRSIDMST